jgi:hypothetical protein
MHAENAPSNGNEGKGKLLAQEIIRKMVKKGFCGFTL